MLDVLLHPLEGKQYVRETIVTSIGGVQRGEIAKSPDVEPVVYRHDHHIPAFGKMGSFIEGFTARSLFKRSTMDEKQHRKALFLKRRSPDINSETVLPHLLSQQALLRADGPIGGGIKDPFLLRYGDREGKPIGSLKTLGVSNSLETIDLFGQCSLDSSQGGCNYRPYFSHIHLLYEQ